MLNRRDFKLTIHKALFKSAMTYACPTWEFGTKNPSIEIVAPAKQGSQHHWQFFKAHIGSRYVCSFPNSASLRLHNQIKQNHPKS
jgi:hypothetical protein